MLAYNLNRGNDDVRLFEAGNAYQLAEGKAVELKRICMGATLESLRKSLPDRETLDFEEQEPKFGEVFRAFKATLRLCCGTFTFTLHTRSCRLPDKC